MEEVVGDEHAYEQPSGGGTFTETTSSQPANTNSALAVTTSDTIASVTTVTGATAISDTPAEISGNTTGLED